MNRYGILAREHWTTYAPSRVNQLENPDEFFTALGEQVAERISTLSREIEAQSPAEPDYLHQVGRLTAIRKQAEETVLTELVWLTPDQVEYDEAEAASQELGELPRREDVEQAIRELQENQADPDPYARLLTGEFEQQLAAMQQTLARIVELEAKLSEAH